MRVESVNVAEPGSISLHGREVPTGIFKRPATGPVRVGPDGLAGDFRVEPRRHGPVDQALSVYPAEHFAHWAGVLGPEGSWPGYFGENLTVRGLTEREVRVGDVLRCGTALVCVTHPRLPCRKLNARVGRRFAGAFLRSRRVGYYLRVLEPGVVAAGDAVSLEARDATAPTIDELVRVTQVELWDVAGLEAVLASPQLGPAWRASVEEKLARARAADGWLGFRALEVTRRQEVCEGMVALELRCPRGLALAPFSAGQFLTVAHRPDPFGGEVLRPYALCGSAAQRDRYELLVELRERPSSHLPDGLVSTHLYRELRPGDVVRAAAPRGHFTLERAAGAPALTFVAQGVGLAPVLSLLDARAREMPRAPAAVAVEVEHGARFPFREALAAKPDLRLVRAAWAPRAHDVAGRDFDVVGELDAAALRAVLPAAGGAVFIAGDERFVARVVAHLTALGVPPSSLHVERFGP